MFKSDKLVHAKMASRVESLQSQNWELGKATRATAGLKGSGTGDLNEGLCIWSLDAGTPGSLEFALWSSLAFGSIVLLVYETGGGIAGGHRGEIVCVDSALDGFDGVSETVLGSFDFVVDFLGIKVLLCSQFNFVWGICSACHEGCVSRAFWSQILIVNIGLLVLLEVFRIFNFLLNEFLIGIFWDMTHSCIHFSLFNFNCVFF